MTRTRMAARIAGGGLLVAWLAAAASVPLPQAPAAPAPAPVPDREFAAIEIQTRELRSRVESPSRPNPSSRNPFRFAARRPAVPVRAPARSTAAPAAPSGVAQLALVGIAEQETGDGAVRTAVISSPDGLFLAREGEPVTERYRVTRIGADAVELGDTATGGTIRLGLR